MANKLAVSTGFDYFVKSEQVLELLQHQSMGRIVIEIKSFPVLKFYTKSLLK